MQILLPSLVRTTLPLSTYAEYITTISDVKEHQQAEEVTLTCELHGYVQSSFTSPVWRNNYYISTKYNITSSDGLSTKIFEKGTATPSVILHIKIRDCSAEDTGNYTCQGTRAKSVTQLTIL